MTRRTTLDHPMTSQKKNDMRIMAVFIGFFVLSGCAQMEEIRQNGLAMQAEGDDARCSSYGLRYGTAEYAQCRMSVDQQRTAAISQAFRAQQPAYQVPPLGSARPSINCTTMAMGGGASSTTCQ